MSPINFIMEKQNKRQACCSLPIADGWSLDESPVTNCILIIYDSHVDHAGDCIGFKSIRKLKKQKLDKMDTDESKSAQI
nr:hypothetical protein [Bacillus subtilis]